MSTTIAVVLFFAVTAYAVFGGADFGAGFWDLVAGGAEPGDAPREVIDHSIGPVWEGNHVWLIFIFVVLWTGFPEAYASITLTLYVPLSLAAFGIVLRGSSFAFRKTVFKTRDRRNFGAAFAVYLVWDSRRLGDPAMVSYFRRRAIGAAVVAGVVAFIGIFVLRAQARYVFDGMTARALPLVILSAVCGTASLVLLVRGAQRGARILAMGAVASIVIGWGVAQWDY